MMTDSCDQMEDDRDEPEWARSDDLRELVETVTDPRADRKAGELQ